jgi:hypothetical protein
MFLLKPAYASCGLVEVYIRNASQKEVYLEVYAEEFKSGKWDYADPRAPVRATTIRSPFGRNSDRERCAFAVCPTSKANPTNREFARFEVSDYGGNWLIPHHLAWDGGCVASP